MQWVDLYFIAFEAHPDGLIRRTPAIDTEFWCPVEFNIRADVPIQLIIEGDSLPDMKRAEPIAEYMAQDRLTVEHQFGGSRYIRGAFYIPENVTDLDIWVRGFHA